MKKKKIISRISSFRLLTHSGISHDSSLYTQFYFFLKIGKSGLFSVLVFCHTYMHVKLYRQTVYKNIKTGKHTLTKMCTDSDVDGRIIWLSDPWRIIRRWIYRRIVRRRLIKVNGWIMRRIQREWLSWCIEVWNFEEIDKWKFNGLWIDIQIDLLVYDWWADELLSMLWEYLSVNE